MNLEEQTLTIDQAKSGFCVLGVRISAVTKEQWLDEVRTAIDDRRRAILVSQNLHSTYICRHEPELVQLQSQADVVRIDGLPLVLVARLVGLPVRRRHRAGFMDILPNLLAMAAQEKWKIYYIGGKPGVADRAAEILSERYPGLQMHREHGYFDFNPGSQEVAELIKRVNRAQPDIVLVGMGMPRQEKFLLRHGNSLNATVLLTCGAALDYVAGEIPMAPRWLSAIGLEWLFRLLAEPRRMWQRYLVEPLHLIKPLLQDFRSRAQGAKSFYWSDPDGDTQ